MMIVTAGLEIYYTGDMANVSGFGVITEVKTDKFGTNYKIKMTDEDDDRTLTIPSISLHEVYSGNGSTRFVPKASYIEYRKAGMTKLMKAAGMSDEEIEANIKGLEVVED